MRRGSLRCGGSLTDVYTAKASISNRFPREAKDFISLEIRFLFLLSHPVKTPMHANRVVVWGSNKSSTVPDLGILKGIEFSPPGLSQTVPFLKGQRMPSTELPALRRGLPAACLTGAWRGRER